MFLIVLNHVCLQDPAIDHLFVFHEMLNLGPLPIVKLDYLGSFLLLCLAVNSILGILVFYWIHGL